MRVGIIGAQGVGQAIAARLLDELVAGGAQEAYLCDDMPSKEVEMRFAIPPVTDFYYAAPYVASKPFNGYMKRTHKRKPQ
jgi:hypothetical protein